jgi:hypothetical protein
MRPGFFFCGALLACLLTGCAAEKPISSMSFFNNRALPAELIAGADMIQLEVGLLERPLYDRFINTELWQLADEQIIPLERKACLEEAGFRIGQVNGLNPSGLQTLLASDRSCVCPKRHYTRAGNPILLPLGPALAHCRVEQANAPEVLEFERADCLLQITPTPAQDNRVHLHCVPRIRYGETELAARYSLVMDRQVKDFEDLAFDITLEINQYLVIGARSDRIGTLGWRCFWRGDEPLPSQRLLAIRVCRPGRASSESSDDPAEESPKGEHVPSVAQLASQPAAQ